MAAEVPESKAEKLLNLIDTYDPKTINLVCAGLSKKCSRCLEPTKGRVVISECSKCGFLLCSSCYESGNMCQCEKWCRECSRKCEVEGCENMICDDCHRGTLFLHTCVDTVICGKCQSP